MWLRAINMILVCVEAPEVVTFVVIASDLSLLCGNFNLGTLNTLFANLLRPGVGVGGQSGRNFSLPRLSQIFGSMNGGDPAA